MVRPQLNVSIYIEKLFLIVLHNKYYFLSFYVLPARPEHLRLDDQLRGTGTSTCLGLCPIRAPGSRGTRIASKPHMSICQLG